MKTLRCRLDQVKPEDLVCFLKPILIGLLGSLADTCVVLAEVKAVTITVGGLSSEFSNSESLEDIKNKLRKKIKGVNPFCQNKKSQDFTTLEKDCLSVLRLLKETMQTSDPSIDFKAGENFWLEISENFLP